MNVASTSTYTYSIGTPFYIFFNYILINLGGRFRDIFYSALDTLEQLDMCSYRKVTLLTKKKKVYYS